MFSCFRAINCDLSRINAKNRQIIDFLPQILYKGRGQTHQGAIYLFSEVSLFVASTAYFANVGGGK
jgi:hypothetical protein